MYTITINNEEPILCEDYGIHNLNGDKTLHLRIGEVPDISVPVNDIKSIEIIKNEKVRN